MVDRRTDSAVCRRDADADATSCTSQCSSPCGCRRPGRDIGLGRAAGRLYAEAGGYPDAYEDAGRPAHASHPGGDRAIPGARDLPSADSILGVKPGSAHADSYRAAPDFDGNEHADTDASGDAHADGDRDASPDDDAHNDSHRHANPDIDSYTHADGQPQPVRGEIAYASARSRPDRQPAQGPRLGSTTDPDAARN